MLLITKKVKIIYKILEKKKKVEKTWKGLILAVKKLILMPGAAEQMEMQPTDLRGKGHMDNACKPSS